MPSEWYENGPYSAMESMALGKPLIVSDKGGLPELVSDGENGYVYSDFSGLENCLNKMLSLSADDYEKMSVCSLNMAKEMFNPEKYVNEIENLYEEFNK